MASAGNDGCPCTDVTQALSSLADRSCITPDGQNGVIASYQAGTCFPLSFGSNTCLQYDLLHDPACDITNVAESDFPAYCIRTWCYVDKDSCARYSEERVFRSNDFSEADIFYSYSTCNSTADDWLEYIDIAALGGIALKANVPSYMIPLIYKKVGGEIIPSAGDEYYENSVPYEGAYVNYINKIIDISNGDVQNISYTHRSRVSSKLHPTSTYSAAVQDVADGLVDMGVAPFWMTGERLKMTAFTVPLYYDKTVLVIPKPGEKQGLMYQTAKVFGPFTPGLWVLLILVIVLTALLSVWFEGSQQLNTKKKRKMKNNTVQRRTKIYARLALDALLEKGIFFFSSGIEQDHGSSLPHKLLMFGFGFFILVSVSAYVANLAAFLTMAVPDYVGTIEGMVENEMTICAHPVQKIELEIKWPTANFVYSDSGKEYYGLLDDYDAGKCDAMAVGRGSSDNDMVLLDMYCERSLVFTESLVVENPIAFPIKPELATGFSHWIMQAEKYHDVSLQKEIESYNELHKWKPSCNVELSDQDDKQNDYTQIEPLNMIFPIMFWATFSIVAIILQTFHSRQIKKARQRNERSTLLLGRSSQIQLERFTSDNTLNTLSANPMETKEQTQDDYESQLAQSIADPNPTLKDDIAEDVSDDCNSYDFFHKSNGTSSTTRSRVTFSKEHDSIEFDNEDYIKNRILGLFDECVQEIKKQKET